MDKIEILGNFHRFYFIFAELYVGVTPQMGVGGSAFVG